LVNSNSKLYLCIQIQKAFYFDVSKYEVFGCRLCLTLVGFRHKKAGDKIKEIKARTVTVGAFFVLYGKDTTFTSNKSTKFAH
jgi:hypothetical protein